MKKVVITCIIVAMACGKGGGGGGGGGGGSATSPGARTPTPPPKKGVSGEIHLSGALVGTFTWKDGLAVDTCGWVPDTKVGGLGVTLSDGKDSFISLTATDNNQHVRKIVLTGGKLHAGSMTGSSGFEMSGTQNGDDSTVTVTYKNAEVIADGQTVTIDGQLAGNCNYSQ